MKNDHLITTVINYCTNDYRFIKKCADEAKEFSHQIIIPLSDHFFNGEKENRKLLNLTYMENPSCEFIEYEFTHDKTYSKYKWYDPSSPEARHLWHSTSRYISHFFIKKNTEYILFLDADEICEGINFLKWLDTLEYKKYLAMRHACYMYFKNPLMRSTILQISPLFIQKKGLDPLLLQDVLERYAIYTFSSGKKSKRMLSQEGLPLFHHYSWVRSKNEKIIKTKTWGHFGDKDWTELIENDTENPDSKKEPYYNLTLEKAPSCYFDPLKVKPNLKQNIPSSFPNVKMVTYLDIFQKELEIQYGI